jgi:MSHA biogenesis protein MshP
MSPKAQPNGVKPSRQVGSTLVMAIFILIVFVLLGSAMMRILSASSETIAFEVVGTRAYSAAQTGLQWRLQQIFTLGPVTLHCDGAPVTGSAEGYVSNDVGGPDGDFDLKGISGLKNCAITALICEDFKHEGVTYYSVKSTGQCAIGSEFTSRTVEVQARSL